jgi:putative hydrolase of the HAD superfamily
MKKEIKTYIFDFGDVFINLDKPATLRELSNLGKSDFNDEMLKMNKLYEKGMVSTDDFLQFYQSQFPQASKQQLADAWNSIILDFPDYRLQFLEDFSQTHQCYLLSNINDLHLTYIKANLDEAFYKRFINCFDKVYYSHEIHLRKPDAEIYKFVLNDAGLQADESLFIDDTFDNIQAAQQAGLRVWHLLPEEDVVDM